MDVAIPSEGLPSPRLPNLFGARSIPVSRDTYTYIHTYIHVQKILRNLSLPQATTRNYDYTSRSTRHILEYRSEEHPTASCHLVSSSVSERKLCASPTRSRLTSFCVQELSGRCWPLCEWQQSIIAPDGWSYDTSCTNERMVFEATFSCSSNVQGHNMSFISIIQHLRSL